MSRRAQLVVLAAAVIAVALLPVVAATVQLQYRPALDDGGGTPVATAERSLSGALDRAPARVPARFGWGDRDAAALATRRALQPVLDGIAAAGPPDAERRVRFNRSAARALAATACPDGPGRAFGPCRGIGGVVVQSRANRTHVVAVAVDVVQVGPDRSVRATVVAWRGR